MARLTIHDFGPVRSIDILLRPINIFMGPQSSGKSTIAKIISFCLWLEKDVVFHQSLSHVTRDFIDRQLINYHSFSKYRNDGWAISYSSDVIEFECSADNYRIAKGNGFSDAKLSKNAYIPSERNIVSLPGISSLKLPDNFLRDFIFDWLEIQSKFSEPQAVELFDLGAKFYYDIDKGRGVTKLENGKELDLSEVSSGMQSAIPLLTYMTYLTKWVYEHKEDISFEKRKIFEKALSIRILTDCNLTEEDAINALNGNYTQENKDLILDVITKIEQLPNTPELPFPIKSVVNLRDNISRPHYSNIVIEEPEQNLFPRTQIALLYHLLAMLNHDRDNIVITTHSPFILYALNNCLLGFLVKDSAKEIPEMAANEDAWTDPDKVAVYELADGTLKGSDGVANATIQDNKGLIRKNYFDKAMAGIMDDFSSLIGLMD